MFCSFAVDCSRLMGLIFLLAVQTTRTPNDLGLFGMEGTPNPKTCNLNTLKMRLNRCPNFREAF